MRNSKILICVFFFFINGTSAMMNKFRFPGKIKREGDGQVSQAVREVIIRAMCGFSNSSVNLNISTEFNTSVTNNSALNDCEQCFLATPLSELFTESGGQNASLCTQQYLPRRFQPCATGTIYGNLSTDDVLECYKDALKNSSIESCSNISANTYDSVEQFYSISSCLKDFRRGFMQDVRMAMMDRVIGRKGCSFSAIIALKLFGNKRQKSLKHGVDVEDAFDELLKEELDQDDLDKPFKWTKDRPRYGGFGSKGGFQQQPRPWKGGFRSTGRGDSVMQRPRREQENGGYDSGPRVGGFDQRRNKGRYGPRNSEDYNEYDYEENRNDYGYDDYGDENRNDGGIRNQRNPFEGSMSKQGGRGEQMFYGKGFKGGKNSNRFG